ncbi:hypothetical protein JTE90_023183 [Oedothorax gibbosus]|uniref:Uncharacterized protein n=1 Tax=Oedothorax gibbosus TaxID=931172 RepID=A0AAV6UH20_9ARAC|nr:hypothetical protein JTE90_023183 [Oedothorax gibbosus]
MTLYVAFWFVPLLNSLPSSASESCNTTVSCPCGSSNVTYTLCIDAVRRSNSQCDVWSHCETCVQNQIECATCPKNRMGPACSEVKNIRKKRQNGFTPGRMGRVFMNGGYGSMSCERLESPEFGSMNCRQTNNFRSCTGRCLPGYSFQDFAQEQITLECRRGKWTPTLSFPPCICGHCNLDVVGSATYNCTTGMDGTRCDVFCDEMFSGRYHCYPGREWIPRLPHCVQPKGNTAHKSCPCQNNGYCDSNGNCVCPYEWTGSYCERLLERPLCSDPGIPNGSQRTTDDGTPANEPRSFDVGEGLLFSCPGMDSKLEGTSVIWCTAGEQWSGPTPKCVKTLLTTCPDPGTVNNAERTNDDGSPSTPDNVYTVDQTVRYTCKEGFRLVGTGMRVCLPNGEWSRSITRCIRQGRQLDRTCRQPEPDSNGFIEADLFRVRLDPSLRPRHPPGTHLTFRCNEGYRSIGPIILYCLKTGEWSSLPPTCEETAVADDGCGHPGVDPNGVMDETPALDPRRLNQRFEPGTEVTYTCRDGFRIDGPTVLFCLLNGEWSSSPPTCTPTTRTGGGQPKQNCPRVPSLSVEDANFVVVADSSSDDDELQEDDSEFPPKTRLHYTCKDNRILIGSNSLVCLSTGYWNPDPPICVEDCGRSHLQTTHHVTNGNTTEVGDWPWTVAIAATEKNVTSIICGGALIDNETVLTAAHCVEKYPYYTLYLGKYYRSNRMDDDQVVTRRTTRIIMHESFNSTTYENDIALLYFEPRVNYTDRIKPICLPTPQTMEKNIVTGKRGSVAGWGFNELKLLSPQLMVAHLPVQPDDECKT